MTTTMTLCAYIHTIVQTVFLQVAYLSNTLGTNNIRNLYWNILETNCAKFSFSEFNVILLTLNKIPIAASLISVIL